MDSLIESSKELSINAAEAIPYKDFKEMINIVKEEIRKNRYIEVWDKVVYSADKRTVKQ
ncbi:hypothetical protein RBU61_13970 [Tissierella sp. MB52-C2]|uniref:hypothetical protein n=1 Tax=Tissierella sp. MB52-C2 TaxID=3070999 RepID=UPI00280BC1DE|nr:hypothetical protein [Tissierella sp. MB52-C2]WMM24022.1 hypothetical protein RBU61_13970 [Tissierella sp. MB52-C2]